jgi:hypothetical protein
MDPRSIYNETTFEYWEYTNICKSTLKTAHRLAFLVHPWINSQYEMEKWTQLLPNLRNTYLRNTNIQITLLHLRFLSVGFTIHFNPNCVLNWNCPLLEHLNIITILLGNSELEMISTQFPNLKTLAVLVRTDIVFSNFTNLQALTISSNSETPLFIYIGNMMTLTHFTMEDGLIDSLHLQNVPNLKSICYRNTSLKIGYFDKLVFFEPVPLFESLVLENLRFMRHGFLKILGDVPWENVKNLQIVYTPSCETICSRLRAIEHLEIFEQNVIPLLHWSQLTHLKHLGWTNPTFNLLSSIMPLKANLVSFSLTWNEFFVMDFALLLHFFNLDTVTLNTQDGPYKNFEALFQLPNLKSLNCFMSNLTQYEDLLVITWTQESKINNIRANFHIEKKLLNNTS